MCVGLFVGMHSHYQKIVVLFITFIPLLVNHAFQSLIFKLIQHLLFSKPCPSRMGYRRERYNS